MRRCADRKSIAGYTYICYCVPWQTIHGV
jgi:hypothetical protein